MSLFYAIRYAFLLCHKQAHLADAEWLDLLLRSTGMEPSGFKKRVKWLHLARLIPLIENNYNLCELGSRGTGKSHVYKEISPNSILVSGGQTTVANLFYNMGSKTMGLVGMWDCVAFDEVAVKKTVSGLVKPLHPDDNFTRESIEEILRFALEMHRRVKEKLKKLVGQSIKVE